MVIILNSQINVNIHRIGGRRLTGGSLSHSRGGTLYRALGQQVLSNVGRRGRPEHSSRPGPVTIIYKIKIFHGQFITLTSTQWSIYDLGHFQFIVE